LAGHYRIHRPPPRLDAPSRIRTVLRLFCGLLVVHGLTSTAPASAHALKVFAAAEGHRVEGRVYYAGGGPVRDARVTVLTPDGRVLAQLESTADGTFAYEPVELVDQLIRVQTLEGHAAEWTVTANAFASAPETRGGQSTAPALGGFAAAAPESAGLEAAVEQAVARQVRPLREELLAYAERVRLQDLLGGIGYILGLAGLALWWRSRRPDQDR
jgi:nickel transport protein